MQMVFWLEAFDGEHWHKITRLEARQAGRALLALSGRPELVWLRVNVDFLRVSVEPEASES